MKDRLYAYFESGRPLAINSKSVAAEKIEFIDKITNWYKKRAVDALVDFRIKYQIIEMNGDVLDEFNQLLENIEEKSMKQMLIRLFFDKYGFIDDESYKQWLADRIDEQIESDIVLINESVYSKLVDYTGRISVAKPSNVVFDEGENILSILIEKVIEIYGIQEALMMTKDKILKAKLKFYSPNEREANDFSKTSELLPQLDLSEVSELCEHKEVSEAEVDETLNSLLTAGYIEIQAVCETTQVAFECAGINLPLTKNISRPRFDLVARYLTQPNLDLNSIGYRYKKINDFFRSYPFLFCIKEDTKILDDLYADFANTLKASGSYRSVSSESHVDMSRSVEIKRLGENILRTYFGDQIECHEKYGVMTFKCTRAGHGEFHFVFCFNANIENSLLEPFSAYGRNDKIYCLKPFSFKKDGENLKLIKEGFLQNIHNLNTFAYYDKRTQVDSSDKDTLVD
jgi:uncharacterized protein YlaI